MTDSDKALLAAIAGVISAIITSIGVVLAAWISVQNTPKEVGCAPNHSAVAAPVSAPPPRDTPKAAPPLNPKPPGQHTDASQPSKPAPVPPPAPPQPPVQPNPPAPPARPPNPPVQPVPRDQPGEAIKAPQRVTILLTSGVKHRQVLLLEITASKVCFRAPNQINAHTAYDIDEVRMILASDGRYVYNEDTHQFERQ